MEAIAQQKQLEEIALATSTQGPVVCEVTGHVYEKNNSDGTARGIVWFNGELNEATVVDHLNKNKHFAIRRYVEAIKLIKTDDGKVGYEVIAEAKGFGEDPLD